MTIGRMALALLAVGLGTGTASAQAATPAECRYFAKADYRTCRTDCRETFLAAKDACRNCDHIWAEACRTSRAACEDPFETLLETCLGGCRATLGQEKAQCAPGDAACVDAAQVRAFTCRDGCRDDPVVREGRRACRLAFRACMRQCPPPG